VVFFQGSISQDESRSFKLRINAAETGVEKIVGAVLHILFNLISGFLTIHEKSQQQHFNHINPNI
jgi:hypothetical protein